jgi:hypothetical protein
MLLLSSSFVVVVVLKEFNVLCLANGRNFIAEDPSNGVSYSRTAPKFVKLCSSHDSWSYLNWLSA